MLNAIYQQIQPILSTLNNAYIINLLSAFTGFVAYKGWNHFRSMKGFLSGRWYGEIYDTNNNIIRYDKYKVKHYGEKLYVKGRRVYPKEQSHRKWDFHGVYRDRVVSGAFKSLDKSVHSIGSVLLKHDYEGSKLMGYYMTLHESNQDTDNFSESIEKVKYCWNKQPNEFYLNQDRSNLFERFKTIFTRNKS